ncbi:hypothetical protein M413DRAFT_428016 [Hebeloma cylindrosporum]|uniref:RRM domain-containing protein n=1 Tax=Hebeloma cylindrosporum TaxID=76867 RepID=A0A0C3BVM9_HEBCY|nr:hypothetical protein M413DRAFT_428016 [Hebeloma cylindrosporum h7]
MSRTDQHDFEYPPGQRPRSNERDPYQDRRASVGVSSFSGFGVPMSRSLAMQDQREYEPNRHNPLPSSPFTFHHHRPSPPPSSSPSDRPDFYRHPQPQQHSSANSIAARSTLWWGDLEPWMDEEYAKQVCDLMQWDPVTIKVPHPAPDPGTGQQANNPGYCFLTFPSPSHAASVLAQISSAPKGSVPVMPNSSKPFVMNWASSVSSASPISAAFPAMAATQPTAAAQQYPKEYSIFVGDLAPETSNSDLVAVFRNPVLGLRNDREPKFIRPFLSCKSAKIMLDPLTGVSRGYGFVRFTDEADQQRALIEMHGLYCLSRPMRISPATAKFKQPTSLPAFDLPQVSFTPPANPDASNQSVTVAVPLPNPSPAKSVSAPIAAAGSTMSLSSNAPSSGSSNSLSSGTGTGSSASIATSAFGNPEEANHALSLAQKYIGFDTSPTTMASLTNPYLHEVQIRQVFQQQMEDPNPRYVISEESWKHHAQARAILGNLIGPNGEQLTSTDPYNTTVFVGGLSPLISEETLRTFFAPFGDIHYVKVPVGKHCGFVQFVRKADAEKAIEKMQGFPIGGSRIRLSWGRSQCGGANASPETREIENLLLNASYGGPFVGSDQKKPEPGPSGMGTFVPRPEMHRAQSNFSPFSPDPNNLYMSSESARRDSAYSRLETLPHPSKAYAPGFFPSQDLKVNTANGRVSPASARPASGNRFGFAENSDPPAPLNRAPGRAEAPISRPPSGQMAPSGGEGIESDPIHDLNGTLASLDLDRPWKSPDIGKRVTSS